MKVNLPNAEEDPYDNAIKQRWSKNKELDYSPYKPGGIFH